MTTIAYRAGILAGDQRLSEKSMVWHDRCRKVFKLPCGGLFGASGDAEPGDLLQDALRKDGFKKQLPKVKDDHEFCALYIAPNGVIWETSGARWNRWPVPYIAIGSGAKCALPVLRLGHDAVTAVKAGIAGDVYSGGRVQTVRLDKSVVKRRV